MKTFRVAAIIVLALCAVAAAYFSYSLTMAPRPSVASNGGPPAGYAQPGKGSSRSGGGK